MKKHGGPPKTVQVVAIDSLCERFAYEFKPSSSQRLHFNPQAELSNAKENHHAVHQSRRGKFGATSISTTRTGVRGSRWYSVTAGR
jgi:hypothetical protein